VATKDIDISGIIGAFGALVSLIAEAAGKTTAELLKEVEADCDKRAKDPSDDSDRARSEIEADLP
jgi:hypothetical protein